MQEFASAVVSALRGGDGRFDVLGSVLTPTDDPVAVAAVRVLGGDALAPCTLAGQVPTEDGLVLFERAIGAFPPKAGGSAVSAWSHWGMRAALRRARSTAGTAGAGTGAGADAGQGPYGDGESGAPDGAAPDTDWVAAQSWQQMTHQLAQLAALAVPGLVPPLAQAVAARPVDLARGFVRAVRRRDWLQAAGAGRWLAVTRGTPESLGLDTGLDFVHHMGAADARVALHVRAAQLARVRGDGAAAAYAGAARG